MKLGADDFLGQWRISREITDLRILESGSLEGDAVFTRSDDGLSYHEKGQLRFAGSAPIMAERRYLWSFGETAITVKFADGAPFHSFALTGAPTATPHLCGEDMYRGIYSFVRFPDWQVTWNVEGPRKAYRSVTHYTRA